MTESREERPVRVVVGVDGSPPSVEALRWALWQAGLTGGSVDAVMAYERPVPLAPHSLAPMVVPPTDFAAIARRVLTDVVTEAAADRPGVVLRQSVREGNPARVLIEASAGADMLVVGSRGHGGFAGLLLGSVGQQCAHHASCPVVIIPKGRRGPPAGGTGAG